MPTPPRQHIPSTPRRHFNEDIARAKAFCSHGEAVAKTNTDLAADLFRSAVATAVGAMDAYLCDAYVDCLTRTLQECRANSDHALPPSYAKELLPVGPLISDSHMQRANWSLRMAVRTKMEKDNLLQIKRVKKMLNPVLPEDKKLWGSLAPRYIKLKRKRMTRILPIDYESKTGQAKQKVAQKAAGDVLKRIGKVVQRRHDIVHNCDRPKSALQSITHGTAKMMVADIKEFITILDDHLNEHRIF